MSKVMSNVLKVSVLALSLASVSAFAITVPSDNGTVTFNGSVTDATCTVTMGNGGTAHSAIVTMDPVLRTDVEQATLASAVGLTPFQIMIECPSAGADDDTAVDKAKFKFTNTGNAQGVDLINSTLIPSTSSDGSTAENVAIAIYNNTATSTDQVLIGGDNIAQEFDGMKTDTATQYGFSFKAGYVPSSSWSVDANPIKPGRVNAFVNFTIDYE